MTTTSDSARRAAREWMDTYHAAFKTNQEREDALAAIISKHFAAAPADNETKYGPSLVAFNLKTGVAYCPYCETEFERQSDGSYLTLHDCKGGR